MPIRFHDYFFQESDVPLNAMLLNCGYDCVSSRNYRWDGMNRGQEHNVVWQYTISGRGAIDIESRHYDVLAGQAFLVRIPSRHVYYFPRKSDKWEFIYMTMRGREIELLEEYITATYGPVLSFQEHSPSVELAWQRIFSPQEESVSQYSAAIAAYRFMLSILEELGQSPARSAEERLIERVNAYLSNHIGEEVGVDSLARAMGISRSHFSRLFHAASGSTAQHYILETRLKFAVRLLRAESISIKETAARCGFSDANYFCRAFRLRYGVTPDAFRRRKHL